MYVGVGYGGFESDRCGTRSSLESGRGDGEVLWGILPLHSDDLICKYGWKECL